MAIRGLEGSQNAEPRVFAHDALDLQPSYNLGDRIPNTETIGVALYIGANNDITVTMEGGSTVQFKGVTAGSFLPVLVTHVTALGNALTGTGELIALY